MSDKTPPVADVTPDIIESLRLEMMQTVQDQAQKYDNDIQELRQQIKAMKNDKEMSENYKTSD